MRQSTISFYLREETFVSDTGHVAVCEDRKSLMNSSCTVNCCYQAISQASAFRSPFAGAMSVIAIYQQSTSCSRLVLGRE